MIHQLDAADACQSLDSLTRLTLRKGHAEESENGGPKE